MVIKVRTVVVGEERLEGDTRKLSEVIEIVSILIRVAVTLINIFFKNHQTVHFKSVHFAICKLYLNILKESLYTLFTAALFTVAKR